MIIPPQIAYRPRRRTPTRAQKVSAPPATLTLVAASYVVDSHARLTFDRAISIGSMVGGAITISDGEDARSVYHAHTPGTLINPTTVEFTLTYVGDSEDDGVTLNATAGSGIVAAEDGGTWAGVSALALPFG